MKMHEPYFGDAHAEAISKMGAQLAISYEAISREIGAFVSSFRMCDIPALTLCMENLAEALKANFDKHDELLYELLKLPGGKIVLARHRVPETDDDEN